MSLTSIFDEYTSSGTQDHINSMVVESVLNENVIVSRLMKSGKTFRGTQEKFSVRVGIDNASAARGGGFLGTDTFDTGIVNETQTLAFNPKFVYEPLNFAYTDLAPNAGKEEVYSLLGRETEYAISNLLDNVGNMLYSTNGASSKEFSGLRNLVTATGTYGGLDRSTYTVLKPGGTTAAGVDSTTTATTLVAVNAVIDALTSGSIKPTIGLTTPAIFSYLEALMPEQRLNIGGFTQVTRDGMTAKQGQLGAAVGLDAIVIKGVPIVRDEKCTAGHLFFLNEKTLGFYKMPFGRNFGWSETSMKPSIVEGQYKENIGGGQKTAISYSGLKEPTNQAASISQFVLAGEMICNDPRRQGGLTALAS